MHNWKGNLKPGDSALDYRFYRFVPHTVKVLDEAEFGDAVWARYRSRADRERSCV